MALHPTHDLHRRRFSRNLGLGLALGALVVLIFALSVVKVTGEKPLQEAARAVQGTTTDAPAETGNEPPAAPDAAGGEGAR